MPAIGSRWPPRSAPDLGPVILTSTTSRGCRRAQYAIRSPAACSDCLPITSICSTPNLTADRLQEALRTPSGHRYRALQQRFTYLPIRPGADTAPQVVLDLETERIASSAEITLVGYSPLLSGAYTRTDRPLPADYSTQDSRRRLDALRSVADEVGLDPGQVVLAWMNQRPTPVLPIVGVSRPEQVHSAWHAVTHVLPDHLIARLQAARA
jgi:aryl-alcohol dehydrogenase-like predicted oxidoreductase